MISKPFKDRVDESDIPYWQVLMSELDSTLPRMKYISISDLKDAYEIEKFNNFWDYVRTSEVVVVSVSEGTDLYELSDSSILIILSENLNEKMIIFDKQDSMRIINRIENCQ